MKGCPRKNCSFRREGQTPLKGTFFLGPGVIIWLLSRLTTLLLKFDFAIPFVGKNIINFLKYFLFQMKRRWRNDELLAAAVLSYLVATVTSTDTSFECPKGRYRFTNVKIYSGSLIH